MSLYVTFINTNTKFNGLICQQLKMKYENKKTSICFRFENQNKIEKR